MRRTRKEELGSLKTGLLYTNSYQSIITIILASLIIYSFSFYELSGKEDCIFRLTLWLLAVLFISIIRVITTLSFIKSTDKISRDRFWRNIFYLFTALSGSGFGISVLFVSQIESISYLTLIVLLLGGISAGSVGALSTSITAFTIYNLPALTPYSIFFLLKDNNLYKMTGIMIIFFFAIIFFTAYRLKRTLEKSFSLKIENDLIIEKLSQSEEKFSKSFYSGVGPMALLRISNAEFIDVNNAMLKLLQYSRDEIIGKNPYDLDLYSNPDDVINIISETSKKGYIKNREITLKTKNGTIKYCFGTIENFRLHSSLIALVMLQDYTQRIEYEKNLKLEKEKAEQAAAAKSKFLATMSHEIRTPMNAVIGMTNLALMTDDSSERNDYLNVVKDSADYLLNLINDILNISKLEAGKIEISLIDTDLHDELHKSYKTMEMIALSKKLEYTLSINEDVPQFVKTAPDRLRQILLNLIGNAIKFTPSGKIEITVSLSNGLKYRYGEENRKYIEFAVKDTGIGIPQNKLEEIFESFTQADNSVFRRFGGTGLGLSISKQLVKMMEGDIQVESEPGKGSTFSFIIPLIKGVNPLHENELTISSGSSTPVVLIAEDNIMNQKLISAYMNKLGLKYSIADNGQEAVKLLKTGKFNVILMDLEMPILNGEEALKKIRAGDAGENYSHIPVYAMSAYNINDIREKCLTAGFTGYITKPVDLKAIKKILEKEIAGSDAV
jgi:PAS domain S-box-containing protein